MTYHTNSAALLRRSLLAAALGISFNGPAHADYASELLKDQPIAYYRFNDNVTIDDLPSSAVNLGSLGTIANGVYYGSFTRGVAGALSTSTAVAFTQPSATAIDNTGGINIPYNPALNPSHTGTNPFTVECWVKPNTNTSTLLTPVNSMSFTTGRAGFLIYQNAATWQLRIGNKGSTTANILDGGTVTPGEWQHLAATYSGGVNGTMTLYVNGVQVGTAVATTGYEANDNAPFAIAATTAPNRTFDGAVDEVAFYNSLLSPADISLRASTRASNPSGYQALVLANAPVGYWRMDEAAFTPRTPPVAANAGSLGTAANAGYYAGAKNSTTGPSAASGFSGFAANNSALSLPNANGYVSLTQSLLNNRTAFTVTGWVKRGAAHSTRGGYFGQNDLLEFGDAANGASIEAYINARGGNIITPYTAADDAWQFIVLTGDASASTLYIDGTQVGQTTGSVASYGTSTFNFNIGGGGIFNTTGDLFRGEIDEVAVFDKALSGSRVQQLYEAALGNVAPTIVNNSPTVAPDVVVTEGQPYTVSVEVTGTPPFTYQWYLNNTPITGATDPSYTIPAALTNTPPGAPYTYHVTVTNGVNTTTSDPIDVTIIPLLQWTSTAATNATKWDISTLSPAPLNWQTFTGATPRAYTDDHSVLFDDNAAGTTVELTQDVTPYAIIFDNDAKNYLVTGEFSIYGPFPATTTKNGSGTAVIATTSLEVDNVVVNEGKLQIGDGTRGALASYAKPVVNGGELAIHAAPDSTFANTTVIGAGGTLSFGGTGDLALTATTSGAGNEVFNRNGVTTINAANSATGTLVVNAGTVAVDGSQTNDRLSPNKLVTVNAGSIFEIHGVNGIPTAANSITVALNQSTLRVFSGGSPIIGPTGTSHTHLGTLVLNGGSVALVYSGEGSAYNGESFQLNRDITVTGTTPSTIAYGDLANAGNAGIAPSSAATHTLTVPNVAVGADLIISAEIENPDTAPDPATAILAKTGAGTLLLDGGIAHTYSGTFQVNEGTLQANGSIAGPVTVADGATLDPGPGTAGFATGALTLNGTYTCDIDGASSDSLAVTGNVTVGASGKIALSVAAGGATAPYYELLRCTGTISAPPVITGIPAGYSLAASTTSVAIIKSDISPQPVIVNEPPTGSEDFESTAGGFTVSAPVSPQTDWTYTGTGWLSFGTNDDVGGTTHTTYLTSPVYTVESAGPVALTLIHKYHFEVDYDAGAVEISVNGAAFVPLPGTAFTSNGYDGSLPPIGSTNSALAGKEGFLGLSDGSPANLTTTATLLATAAAGDTVQVRFIGAYDDAFSEGGWTIDSFAITNALPQLLRLSWPLGVIQYSDNLMPPWTDLPGDSPVLIDTKAAPKRFFRLKP